MTRLLYLQDPHTLEFEAQVTAVGVLPDGRPAAWMDATYFYPTGGGQYHDTGVLGPAQVVEVIKDVDGQVIHVLDRTLSPGRYPAQVDRLRRLRHMQHHTAQHLLSYCFLSLFEIDSASAHITGNTPSTVDLATPDLLIEQVEAVEDLANAVVFEDREVRSYFVSPTRLAELPLRRSPAVSEDIRIVEIGGLDFTPCGGTHCTRTGQMGLIKIVKSERRRDQTRIYFTAGLQSLDGYRQVQAIASSIASEMGVAMAELPTAVHRQLEALKSSEYTLNGLRRQVIVQEAAALAAGAESLPGGRLALASFSDRLVPELRQLGSELAAIAGLVSVLACASGDKLSLVAACGPGAALPANQLLSSLLADSGGRGGGDAYLAQGGGALTALPVTDLFAAARRILSETH